MEISDTPSDFNPNKWRGRLILSLRWILGGFVGLIVSLSLYMIHPPILGPITLGQEQLLFYLIFDILYERFGSTELIFTISVILFSTIWMVISALIFSGKKRQIRLGAALITLYSIIGMIWYMILLIGVISH